MYALVPGSNTWAQQHAMKWTQAMVHSFLCLIYEAGCTKGTQAFSSAERSRRIEYQPVTMRIFLYCLNPFSHGVENCITQVALYSFIWSVLHVKVRSSSNDFRKNVGMILNTYLSENVFIYIPEPCGKVFIRFNSLRVCKILQSDLMTP